MRQSRDDYCIVSRGFKAEFGVELSEDLLVLSQSLLVHCTSAELLNNKDWAEIRTCNDYVQLASIYLLGDLNLTQQNRLLGKDNGPYCKFKTGQKNVFPAATTFVVAYYKTQSKIQ